MREKSEKRLLREHEAQMVLVRTDKDNAETQVSIRDIANCYRTLNYRICLPVVNQLFLERQRAKGLEQQLFDENSAHRRGTEEQIVEAATAYKLDVQKQLAQAAAKHKEEVLYC